MSLSPLGFNQPASVILNTPAQSQVYEVANNNLATIAYTVASINTNVVIRIEASTNGINYFNLVADQTHTTNATFAPVLNQWACYSHVRITFLSESGGTAATITLHPCFA
jgi:hypothetical protein